MLPDISVPSSQFLNFNLIKLTKNQVRGLIEKNIPIGESFRVMVKILKKL